MLDSIVERKGEESCRGGKKVKWRVGAPLHRRMETQAEHSDQG